MMNWLRRRIDKARIRDPRWLALFEEDPSGEVVSVDCETTGFDTKRDDIISISAIKISGNKILTSQAFNVFVRPEAEMRADAIRIHQLRAIDVERARPMREVLPEFLEFLGGRPLVGYWIDYDWAMINRYVKEYYGFNLPNRRIEVSALYYDRKYGDAPQGTQIDLSFAAITRDLGLRQLALHDAFNDALSAGEMYVQLLDMKARGVKIERAHTHDNSAGITAG
ncbi:MAG: 3'-5' exonuclease [Siculibacillus sp.]